MKARIAVICLFTVLLSIMLVASHANLNKSFLLWLIFIIISGIIIDKNEDIDIWDLLYVVPPCMVLFLSLSYISFVGYFNGETGEAAQNYCMSCDPHVDIHAVIKLSPIATLERRLILNGIVSIATVPGLLVGIFASDQIKELYRGFRRLPVATLKSTQLKLKILVSILGIIVAAVIAF